MPVQMTQVSSTNAKERNLIGAVYQGRNNGISIAYH
jgi:hypothetical protein